jgi:hypothetical protein
VTLINDLQRHLNSPLINKIKEGRLFLPKPAQSRKEFREEKCFLRGIYVNLTYAVAN